MGWREISTHLIVGLLTASPTPEADEDGDPEKDGGDGNPDGLGVAYLLQSPRV